MMILVGVNKLKKLSYHIDMHILNTCTILIMPHCVIVVHIDSLMTSQSDVDILIISQPFAAMYLESGMGPMHRNNVSCWY